MRTSGSAICGRWCRRRRVGRQSRPASVRGALGVAALALAAACHRGPSPFVAYVGTRLISGTGGAPIDDAALVVRDGRIVEVGKRVDVRIPRRARLVDLGGRTMMPGLINAHGHVGDTQGLEAGHYSAANVLAQLGTYARYGVTTVMSLGGDGQAAVAIRQAQDSFPLTRARLHFAGAVVEGDTPAAARKMVDENAAMGVDLIKIRVDDNLGTTRKMSPSVYQAAIAEAHRKRLRVAVHVYYLDDAKRVLEAGADYIAHSVRDRAVDNEFITLMKQRNACYCPTLMREVSTFVYESTPEFFSDPFFLRDADSAVVAALENPKRQAAVRADPAAQTYKAALVVAKRNLKRVSDTGVKIAMGTDTGPPARFQGYFEHLELEQMVDAGLTPMQALLAATRDAASCMQLTDVGTLETGKWADFVVLDGDPLADIRNTRMLDAVYVAGTIMPSR